MLITDLDQVKQRLRTEWAKLDDVVAAAIHQWSRRQVQISDACFVHLVWQYSQHAMINLIQIWQILRPQLRWEKFLEFPSLTTLWHNEHFKIHKVV